MDPELLGAIGYITGELHGERDFEFLDWLESNGFAIECKKSMRSPLFVFTAKQRTP